MRILMFLLQKEFRQIFRNPVILRLILIVPVMQLLILPLAADFEIRNINISIVDHDNSPWSQRLISKISSSEYFKIAGFEMSYNDAFRQIEDDKADLIMVVPEGFEQNLSNDQEQQLFIAVNAINGAKARVGGVYLTNIITDFNTGIRSELIPPHRFNTRPLIEVQAMNWFNPFLNYRTFMVPGILVLLVTMVGVYMCTLNLVKEKEVGTIEQINVTPIKKTWFILGKLIPFWIIGMLVFSIGLFLIGRLVYGIVPLGSLTLIYAYLALYLIAVLGIGLLISTYSATQQQAMSLVFFFIMIFILMSGLFTPVDGMPGWAKVITRINPVTYFIEVMRMVVMKGSGFADIQKHFIITTGFAVFFNWWAIINYKKTS